VFWQKRQYLTTRFPLKGYAIVVTAFYGGFLCCHLLRSAAGFGPVAASSLTGLAGTLLPTFRIVDKPLFQAAVYSGSFAGMCSSEIVDRPWQIALVSLLGGLVWMVLTPVFPGVGGKLGAIAFATTALALLVRVCL